MTRLDKNRLFERTDDEIGRFRPAHVAQHHLGRQNLRARVHIVFARVFGRRAMGGLKTGHGVRQVGARRNADAAHLGRQRVGNVVAVQVQRGHHRILRRAQQNLLQESVGNAVLDGDFLARLRDS